MTKSEEFVETSKQIWQNTEKKTLPVRRDHCISSIRSN